MDQAQGGKHPCKISMLWNWYTIDACFISSDWHVTSNGGFAVSCLGVIGLVMALEFLRRLVMEYDIYLVRKRIDASSTNKGTVSGSQGVIVLPFKPTITEQSIRAGLYTAQFVVGYFVMLLAMHYNGFIILCIFIGAYLGCFASHWGMLGRERSSSASAAGHTAGACCV